MHLRQLTLASIALVAVVSVAPSAAAAGAATSADGGRGCGRPEIPPVYTSIEHPAVTETEPAVTEPGWRWERSVPTTEREYAVPEGSETVWLVDGVPVPEGYAATGATRAGVPVVESTSAASATAPEGEGWTVVPDSQVELVITPERVVEVVPAWVEDFIVVPGQAATKACRDREGGTVAGAGVGAPATGADRAALVRAAAPVRATAPAASSAGSARTLPATGTPVPPWLVALGAGCLVAGSLLVRGRRARVAP
ncbi:hypothetical protein [Pimelobacter sp. 30-1]|uniref:hypothetical protein n=1 Tax=Pimelobacter sp. 30-1 TaxID=2004991 RepID=UPI001C059C73|nr:hypothetical protein [Pimelobacter sp. 30-1]MBU2698167.1 hypothetical protein [Pimelobacter sp. 30-1]